MNKKKLLTVATVLATTLLLASCGSDKTNENKEPVTWAGSTVKEQPVVDTNSTEKKETPTVYVVGWTDEMKTSAPQWLVFIDETDERSVQFKKLMKENSWSDLTIEPTEEGKKQWAQPLTIKVWEYAPLFVFDSKVPDFDYERIVKENPNLIYTVDTKDGKFFAFKDPSFLGAWKESVILNDEYTKKIENSTMVLTDNVKSDEKLIMVEDPLCPYCAKRFLEWNDQELMNKYDTKVLWLALDIPWHENSKKLIEFLGLNLKDGKLDVELMKAIFEKQTELWTLEIKDGSEIKKVLESSSYKDSVSALKTWDLSVSKLYNADEANEAASILWVSGTPTTFIYKDNKFTYLVEEVKETKEVSNETAE